MAEGNKSQVSVLLVDDHAVVREGYRRLLERHGDIAVIGEAVDAAAAHFAIFAVSSRRSWSWISRCRGPAG